MGTILVSGASGYIGGRLVPELMSRGYKVRVMARTESPELREKWPDAEIVIADAFRPESLDRAMEGVHTVYYLIHSLLLGPDQFESADILAALNFKEAAQKAQVKRIIYLGGLGDTKTTLSPHLASRIKVAEELQKGSVPVTILRAAIIIGSGSASYEIIKHLVKNVPILPIPPWAHTRCQPIAVRDVIKYLIGVLEVDDTIGKSYDIGGNDILTYEMMLKILAEVQGQKRIFFPVPLSSIPLYAYLVSLVTPVPHAITRCLLESSSYEVICQNNNIRQAIPFDPLGYKEAIVRALSREEQDSVRTRWSDAYPPAHQLAIKLCELNHRPRFVKSYSRLSSKSAAGLFASFCSIGGSEGWFNSNWMWRLRGSMDRLLMGVGSSRGRKSLKSLTFNDVIDFWRVEDIEKDSKLLLRAEMKLPGKAWLKFSIDPEGEVRRLMVTAYYDTSTLWGLAYWYMFLPFHHFIFIDLLRQIDRRSNA